MFFMSYTSVFDRSMIFFTTVWWYIFWTVLGTEIQCVIGFHPHIKSPVPFQCIISIGNNALFSVFSRLNKYDI